jgi:hypothetical protein
MIFRRERIDYACGPAIIPASKRLGAKNAGVDLSPAMIDVAR